MFVEMAYVLSPDIPVFPGSPMEEFLPNTRLSRGQESNTTIITHYLHNGTHVDAPFHFYDKGQTIDQVPIENFVFEHPLIIEKRLRKGGLIQPEDILACGLDLHIADLLILNTGYHKLRGDAVVYADDFPAISHETAKLIRTQLLNIKALAIDTLSIESCKLGPQMNFPVHKSLLDSDLYPERPILIFEDVNIAPVLGKKIRRVYGFPLRLAGLDGSPVEIVAEVE
jgi:arylformamidase